MAVVAVVAGVDAGKASLDVSVSEGPVLRFDNTAKGITRLLRHLAKQEAPGRLRTHRRVRAAVGEPPAEGRGGGTGGQPQPGESLRQGLRLRSQDRPAGCQVLSRYGPVLPESETPGTGPEREELQDLLRSRRQLVEQRVQEVNRLDKGVSAGVAESTRRHIAWLEAEIAQLEKEYQEALQGSAQLAQRAALYRTAPGVGPLTAATLVAFLPELGQWESRALT